VAAGGVALGTGIFFFLGSDAKFQELTDGSVRSTREADELRDSGKKQQNLARIGLSAGTMLLITGAAMALFTAPEAAPVVSVGKDHVSVGIAGELP
jgi:hypothetical protein